MNKDLNVLKKLQKIKEDFQEVLENYRVDQLKSEGLTDEEVKKVVEKGVSSLRLQLEFGIRLLRLDLEPDEESIQNFLENFIETHREEPQEFFRKIACELLILSLKEGKKSQVSELAS